MGFIGQHFCSSDRRRTVIRLPKKRTILGLIPSPLAAQASTFYSANVAQVTAIERRRVADRSRNSTLDRDSARQLERRNRFVKMGSHYRSVSIHAESIWKISDKKHGSTTHA
jgi:hypothetical protein